MIDFLTFHTIEYKGRKERRTIFLDFSFFWKGPQPPFFFFHREKKSWDREKFQYSAREVFKLAEKKTWKLPEKKKLCTRKKQQNSTREKKNPSREKNGNLCPRQVKKYPRKNPFQNIYYEFFLMLFLRLWRAYVMLIFLNLFNAFVKAVLSLFAKFFVRLRRASVIVKLATWS